MDEYDYKVGQRVEVDINEQPPGRGVVTGIAPNRHGVDYFLVRYRDRAGRDHEEWFAGEELEAVEQDAPA